MIGLILGMAAALTLGEQHLKDTLLDYDSAKVEIVVPAYTTTYQPPRAYLGAKKKPPFEAQVFCYKVNAKNGFGGYVGWRKYVLMFDGQKLFDEYQGETCAWRDYCAAKLPASPV